MFGHNIVAGAARISRRGSTTGRTIRSIFAKLGLIMCPNSLLKFVDFWADAVIGDVTIQQNVEIIKKFKMALARSVLMLERRSKASHGGRSRI